MAPTHPVRPPRCTFCRSLDIAIAGELWEGKARLRFEVCTGCAMKHGAGLESALREHHAEQPDPPPPSGYYTKAETGSWQ
jgi:hypothetical protein